jgi:tetratricopeptide (TPR) repeat protein
VGDVLLKQGDPPAALAEYRTALELWRHLAEKYPRDYQRQSDLSLSYSRVGDLLRDQGDSTAALGAYRAALDIQQRLAGTEPSYVQWKRDLSVTNMVRTSDQDSLDAVLDEYRIALDIAQRLAASPDSTESQRELLALYERFGSASLRRNDFSSALDHFEKAGKIALHLKEMDPDTAESAQDLSRVQSHIEETRRKIAASGGGNRRH